MFWRRSYRLWRQGCDRGHVVASCDRLQAVTIVSPFGRMRRRDAAATPRLPPHYDGKTPPPHQCQRRDADGTSRRRYTLPCLNLADSMAEINRRPMAVNPNQPNNKVGTCKSAMNDNIPRRMSDGTAPDMKSSIFSAMYCR